VTRILGILNPLSGRADPGAVEQALRLRFPALEVVLPPEGSDLVALVHEHLERLRPELVVVSGGDGTISAVASATAGTPTRLGLVPSGTANVLARELGIPVALEDACDVLAHGTPRRVDAMDLGNGRRCLCRVAIGIFGEVADGAPPVAKKIVGNLAYAAAAVPLLTRTEPRRFELVVDGVAVTHEGSCVVVTNVAEIGASGLRWGDEVHLDDGRLDVFVVCSTTLPENLRVLWNALAGDAGASPDVVHLVADRHVEIVVEEELAVVADGEQLRGRALRIDCAAAALEVMGPPIDRERAEPAAHATRTPTATVVG
jgi:diacylglycerol kinase (ATP)